MNTYIVKRLPEGTGLPDLKGDIQGAWADCPTAQIGNYIWDKNGYKPHAEARVMYSDEGLYVHMRAFENEVRAQEDYCGRICQDSCLEFFLSPNIDVDRYTNIEMNPLGKYMCGIGRDRYERFEATVLPLKGMHIVHSVTDVSAFSGPVWEIAYTVPASWIQLWFGVRLHSGMEMRGNFYKCGDKTRFEHYGMWNVVASDHPDFHRPESFGKLILE